jgi:hypothetical protein
VPRTHVPSTGPLYRLCSMLSPRQLPKFTRRHRQGPADDCFRMFAEPRPARRREHEDRKPAVGQVLLMTEVAICRDEHVEVVFCRRQKFPVAQRRPPELVRRRDVMANKSSSQWGRGSLIEEYPHPRSIRPRSGFVPYAPERPRPGRASRRGTTGEIARRSLRPQGSRTEP